MLSGYCSIICKSLGKRRKASETPLSSAVNKDCVRKTGNFAKEGILLGLISESVEIKSISILLFLKHVVKSLVIGKFMIFKEIII